MCGGDGMDWDWLGIGWELAGIAWELAGNWLGIGWDWLGIDWELAGIGWELAGIMSSLNRRGTVPEDVPAPGILAFSYSRILVSRPPPR